MKTDYSNFSRLFNKVKNYKDMDSDEKMILTEIISHTLDNKPFNYTNPQLANWLGMSEGSVKTKLAKLRKKDIIHSSCKNIQPPNGGKYFKQRTLSVLNIEKWIDRKESIFDQLTMDQKVIIFNNYLKKHEEARLIPEESVADIIIGLSNAQLNYYLSL